MFSLRQFFGNSDNLYELLQRAAVETHQSTRLLAARLNSQGGPEISGALAVVHQNVGDICASIRRDLATASATELAREDFESLAQALFKISRASKKFAGQFSFASSHLQGVTFVREAELMTRASGNVLAMVKQLRKPKGLAALKRMNDGLRSIENEANDLMREIRGELYAGGRDALRVIVILDLDQLAEKVITRCSEAGELLTQIALKSD